MKKIIILLLFTVCYAHVNAWGPTGHRATGWIADKYLNKKARKEIERVLSGQSLAMASTWMDEIRSDSAYDYTADWHWVTLQDGQTYEQSEKNPKGDIIQALEKIITELKSKTLTPEEETRRVKMLIHLIGDIHQPLHVGGGSDRGGNDVRISWFRNESNLHRVWDSEMIDDTKLSYSELGQSLDKPTPAQLTGWQNSSVKDWAYESMAYRKQVYDYGNGKLGYQYSYKYFHIVRYRLLQAGIRVASVLNEIYG
ncbi:S1/P1 nuclease [Fulvivirgaceae bacterium PWU5]|uniref:S1/P1 nuclease n=1 Tax=Dawidia cretensis TaxID=2782350 RepID=A0AAP2DWX1_9BACT|nr:S1/P1 nuclease [Dawidia cretensis]MBT1708801.1 S1/P1 nuclease [Dawidia cretensis]